jgi:hypothetical protein
MFRHDGRTDRIVLFGGVLDNLSRTQSSPAEIHEERGDMTRHLIVHTCAERERAPRAGIATPRGTWDDAAVGLVYALVGLWRAPFTPKAS